MGEFFQASHDRALPRMVEHLVLASSLAYSFFNSVCFFEDWVGGSVSVTQEVFGTCSSRGVCHPNPGIRGGAITLVA
jgi:hypothetical protein